MRRKIGTIILKVNPVLVGRYPTVSLTTYKSLFEEMTEEKKKARWRGHLA